MALVSQREFARMRSQNPGYVAKLKSRGMLVMEIDADGREMVNVEASLQRIAEGRDPAKEHMAGVNQRQREQHRGPGAVGYTPPEPAEAPAAPDPASPTYNKARTATQVYEAKLKQLQFDRESGQSLNLEEAKRIAYTAFRGLRDSLLNVPARIMHQVAAEADPLVVESIIDRELQSALANVNVRALLTEPVEVD